MAASIPYASSCDGPPSADRQDAAIIASSIIRLSSSSSSPRCGESVYYWIDPEHIAVPVGAFADPNFPAPRVSVWEDRMHPGVGLPDGIEHIG